MTKKRVFIFWIGDKKKITPIINKISSFGFDVHVGPTKDEHNYLYKNYSYYRLSYDQKIWAFCSDVWRIFVLSKYEGMYTDVSVDIGNNFVQFYEKYSKNDVTLFKESSNHIANSIMFSGDENNAFFKDLLSLYKIGSENLNVRIFPISPVILSAYVLRKYGSFEGFESVFFKSKISICIYSLLEIRNPKTIKKTGHGSWSISSDENKNLKAANEHWDKQEKNWRNKVVDNNRRSIELLSKREGPIILATDLRKIYDKCLTKEELKLLTKKYKEIDYKLLIKERLIWSKIYRFFHLRWFSSYLISRKGIQNEK